MRSLPLSNHWKAASSDITAAPPLNRCLLRRIALANNMAVSSPRRCQVGAVKLICACQSTLFHFSGLLP